MIFLNQKYLLLLLATFSIIAKPLLVRADSDSDKDDSSNVVDEKTSSEDEESITSKISGKAKKYRSDRAVKVTSTLWIDYAFSMENFAALMASKPKDGQDISPDVAKAIKTFIKPMKTFQKAAPATSERVLKDSLKQLIRILRNTSHKASKMDLKLWTFEESIFSQQEIDAVLKARKRLFDLVRKGKIPTARKRRISARQKVRLQHLLNKVEKIPKKTLRAMINQSVDWKDFAKQYNATVTKIVKDDFTIAKASARILAKYLQDGQADTSASSLQNGSDANTATATTDDGGAAADSSATKTDPNATTTTSVSTASVTTDSPRMDSDAPSASVGPSKDFSANRNTSKAFGLVPESNLTLVFGMSLACMLALVVLQI